MLENKDEKKEAKNKKISFTHRCLLVFNIEFRSSFIYEPVNDKEIFALQNKLCNQFNNRSKWEWDCLWAVTTCVFHVFLYFLPAFFFVLFCYCSTACSRMLLTADNVQKQISCLIMGNGGWWISLPFRYHQQTAQKRREYCCRCYECNEIKVMVHGPWVGTQAPWK